MTKNKLSKKEIVHLAHLAGLTLTDDEIVKYQEQLENTIDYIKNLDELDVTGIPATNSVGNLKNVTYEDGSPSLNRLTEKEALQNAKKVKENEFVVERIME